MNSILLKKERLPQPEIASAFSISRFTAYRYLVYLSENHDIAYEKGEIRTSKMNRINLNGSRAAIVGAIPCGEATSEEECVEEYVKLPESLFGSGAFIFSVPEETLWRMPVYMKRILLLFKSRKPQRSAISLLPCRR